MKELIENIVQGTEILLQRHIVKNASFLYDTQPLTGEFGMRSGQSMPDLYGMVDAVYILYIIGKLDNKTTISSRKIWAQRILACQDEQGWFSRLNLRGHSPEHATAYAIGALKLLEVTSNENYLAQIRVLSFLRPLLTDYDIFLNWIKYLQFRLTVGDILKKNVGWHHIWRGSHIGGGIAAIIGMVEHLFSHWWPDQVDVTQWFKWYFDWLDTHANPKTGYWQRAFWNYFYHRPTIIDMGGAVHFFWIYEALARPFPYPAAVIKSTLELQRKNGLYKDFPFCIDLDGNFCIIRSFLQLPDQKKKEIFAQRLYLSVEKNFTAIIKSLNRQPIEKSYSISHDYPGALAALAECTKLPEFKYSKHLKEWRHPFDKVWWL